MELTTNHHLSENGAWFVYLLACADGTLYCGVTSDLRRRLKEHNGQLPGGARYTKGRRPVQMLGSIPAADRAAAGQLEYRIKKLPRRDKLALFGQRP